MAPVVRPAVEEKRPVRVRWILAGALLLVAAGTIAYFALRGSESPSPPPSVSVNDFARGTRRLSDSNTWTSKYVCNGEDRSHEVTVLQVFGYGYDGVTANRFTGSNPYYQDLIHQPIDPSRTCGSLDEYLQENYTCGLQIIGFDWGRAGANCSECASYMTLFNSYIRRSVRQHCRADGAYTKDMLLHNAEFYALAEKACSTCEQYQMRDLRIDTSLKKIILDRSSLPRNVHLVLHANETFIRRPGCYVNVSFTLYNAEASEDGEAVRELYHDETTPDKSRYNLDFFGYEYDATRSEWKHDDGMFPVQLDTGVCNITTFLLNVED